MSTEYEQAEEFIRAVKYNMIDFTSDDLKEMFTKAYYKGDLTEEEYTSLMSEVLVL